MAKSYHLQSGNIYELSAKGTLKCYLKKALVMLRRLFYLCVSIVGTFAITCYVYLNCVTPITNPNGENIFKMSDCITTGSLFATFGSAIIAVFTLNTSKHISRFYDNISILMQDLSGETQNAIPWKRWSFIPRIGRMKLSSRAKYIGLNNASIVFYIKKKPNVFSIPTTESDIAELPVLRFMIQMILLRKAYLQELEDTSQIEEYPAWDCMLDIYRSALLYRISSLWVWIGVCFVVQSVIFAFLYPNLHNIVFSVQT